MKARNIGLPSVAQMRSQLVKPNPHTVQTEIDPESINPIPGVLRNANPLHDSAQRVHDKREFGVLASPVSEAEIHWTPTGESRALVYRTREKFAPMAQDASTRNATYAHAIRTLANRIADKYIRRAKVSCAHLRSEFICEIESSLGFTLGVRASRFPRLASDLLARFACDALPNSTRRSLHFAALKSCDARLRHLSKNIAQDTAYFSAFDTEENGKTIRANDAEKLAGILARCQTLNDTLNLKASLATSNRTRGQIKSARKLIERAQCYAIASVESERFAFRSPLSFHAEIETIDHVLRNAGKFAGKRCVKMATGKIVSHSALWKQAKRLGETLGLALV